MEQDLVRFNKYIKKINGCWLWTGAKDIKGYGIFFYKKKSQFAHRVSLLLHEKVKELQQGLQVCHSCTNKNCVNPEHLREDTQLSNSEDKRRDKTNCAGIRCHFAKLTWEIVDEIRSNPKLDNCSKYNVSKSTITKILNGKSWKAEFQTPLSQLQNSTL